MTLRFAYAHIPVPRPVVPLRGRWSRPRPLVAVAVIGPAGTKVRTGLLDSGSDDTVFPEPLAGDIGIDLANAPAGQAAAANRGAMAVRYAQVRLRITDGVEFREWPAWVGFTTAPINRPLLGFAGFLQFFSAHFLGDHERVELTVNSFYPGT
jgi:hypothetical protein